ncbi:hypothetical protein K474DRAFT_1516669 [Panus rudis PR-1116 ss-1]|nr:hypothetical protein K474DRAFT_1516669 [Panus rudis PR-1116 ss-1]
MSAIARDNDYKERCNYCYNKFEKEKLKRCSRCRFVKYCSRDCQKAAWPTHKRGCSDRFQKTLAVNKTAAQVNRDITTWLDFWRNSVTYWALIAMDLANSPRDKLATHCFFIELDYRPNQPTKAQIFQLSDAAVLTREEFAKYMRDSDTDEELVQEWLKDQRGPNTVHVCICHVAGTARFLWFDCPNLHESREDPETSKALAEGWRDVMAYSLDTGKGAIGMNGLMDLVG